MRIHELIRSFTGKYFFITLCQPEAVIAECIYGMSFTEQLHTAVKSKKAVTVVVYISEQAGGYIVVQ